MDHFTKFQPIQTVGDKIVLTFGLYLCINLISFSGSL